MRLAARPALVAETLPREETGQHPAHRPRADGAWMIRREPALRHLDRRAGDAVTLHLMHQHQVAAGWIPQSVPRSRYPAARDCVKSLAQLDACSARSVRRSVEPLDSSMRRPTARVQWTACEVGGSYARSVSGTACLTALTAYRRSHHRDTTGSMRCQITTRPESVTALKSTTSPAMTRSSRVATVLCGVRAAHKYTQNNEKSSSMPMT